MEDEFFLYSILICFLKEKEIREIKVHIKYNQLIKLMQKKCKIKLPSTKSANALLSPPVVLAFIRSFLFSSDEMTENKREKRNNYILSMDRITEDQVYQEHTVLDLCSQNSTD